MRLSEDVVDYFQEHGKTMRVVPYQSLINLYLRDRDESSPGANYVAPWQTDPI